MRKPKIDHFFRAGKFRDSKNLEATTYRSHRVPSPQMYERSPFFPSMEVKP
jgi:hypothetical protein